MRKTPLKSIQKKYGGRAYIYELYSANFSELRAMLHLPEQKGSFMDSVWYR